MNDDERLFCRCGGEGRIVEVDEGTLAIGHVNGGRAGHRFRLARPAAVDIHPRTRGASDGLRGHRRLTKESVPATGRIGSSRAWREVPATDPAETIPVASSLRGTPAPASEAGLTPAAPRVGNAAGRRRSTRRRVSPASAA